MLRMALSSASTPDEIRDAYYDNAACAEVGSTAKAYAFKLKDGSDDIRRHADLALSVIIGPGAKTAVPALSEALSDDLIHRKANEVIRKIRDEE